MPPRTRRTRFESPPAAPAAPAEPYRVPSSSTVHLDPSHSPGYALHANLFFTSDEWIGALRKDVDALLSVFARAWAANLRERQGEEANEGLGEDGRQDRPFSPFEVFKGCWIKLGWSRIHLVGAPEGPWKKRWGEGVLRAFLEQIKHGENSLKQVAAFFAIYTFWSTQLEEAEKVFVKVDPPTFEYLLSLPDRVAASLHRLTALSPLPYCDVSFALHSLLSDSAFLLVPTQTYTFPPLPAVSLIDTSGADDRDLATLLLGAQEEAEALRKGEFSKVARFGNTAADEDEEDEEDEEEKEDDLPSWGAPTLRTLVEAYAASKTASATLSNILSSSLPPEASNEASTSTLLQPRNKLQLDVLRQAEEKVQQALDKLAGGGGGRAGGKRGRGLLSLISGPEEEENEEEGRGKKRRRGGGGSEDSESVVE
ncbi:hypothetical protein JCM8547_004741 [Rhodosporidiobolus lusitaniae]